jgi:hypothetical protein
VLYRNGGNFGIGKALGDEHNTNCNASNDILNQPLIVVVRKPLCNGQLLNEIVNSCGWEASRNGFDPSLDSVDIWISLVLLG